MTTINDANRPKRNLSAPPDPRARTGSVVDIADATAEPPADRVFHMPEATLPEPPHADDEPAAAPLPAGPPTLGSIYPRLAQPFKLSLVEIKPGATTGDKARALALAYVDPRAYQARLDRVVGPDGWTVSYRPAGERSLICTLTILGVTKEDIGECDQGDPNQMTSAAMQGFKRACAAFGLGRYLYALPQPWVAYDQNKRAIADPSGTARRIYQEAGLPV